MIVSCIWKAARPTLTSQNHVELSFSLSVHANFHSVNQRLYFSFEQCRFEFLYISFDSCISLVNFLSLYTIQESDFHICVWDVILDMYLWRSFYHVVLPKKILWIPRHWKWRKSKEVTRERIGSEFSIGSNWRYVPFSVSNRDECTSWNVHPSSSLGGCLLVWSKSS